MTIFIQSGMAYDQISSILQGKNPTARGLSPRSIRRFCQINNLGRNCKLHVKKSEQKFINVFLRYFKPLLLIKMSVVKMLLT